MNGRRRIALLRGINVGRARRIAMTDLRALFEALGHTGVRTLLTSGNVVFDAKAGARGSPAGAIENALAARLGGPARAFVLSAAELKAAVDGNPLQRQATDPSRLYVAFLDPRAARAPLEALAARDWAPEAYALGRHAAYLWCPAGQIESPLAQAFGRALGEAGTLRNWATTTKLLALAGAAD